MPDVVLDATCTWDPADVLSVDTGYGVLDTGATLNLIGAEIWTALHDWLRNRGHETPPISMQICSRTFRFGGLLVHMFVRQAKPVPRQVVRTATRYGPPAMAPSEPMTSGLGRVPTAAMAPQLAEQATAPAA